MPNHDPPYMKTKDLPRSKANLRTRLLPCAFVNTLSLHGCTVGHGQSPEMQLCEVREYCQRRGWQVVSEYVDTGISGAKDSRPEQNRLIGDQHRRRFDAAVVWKFDRFARSDSHLLRALETFDSLGIAFVSLSEQIDTTTPTGKMVFPVLGAVAELERSLIAERVRAGLRSAKARGKQMGRPRVAVDCPAACHRR